MQWLYKRFSTYWVDLEYLASYVPEQANEECIEQAEKY
jgi:hypothetical protein